MSAANRLPISANDRRKRVVRDVRASIGFVRNHEIVVRDSDDPAVEIGRLRVGPETRISVRPIRKGSQEFFDLVRRRVQRQRDRDRNAILQYCAGMLVLADASAVSRYEAQLEAIKLTLSRLPQQAWPVSTTRIRLPTIYCSRPYFPAAP
jgi:hypothetical protein